MLKNLLFLYRVSKMYLKNKEVKRFNSDHKIVSHMYEFKLNQLLKHIEF